MRLSPLCGVKESGTNTAVVAVERAARPSRRKTARKGAAEQPRTAAG
jgi:hypothetical protein